MREVQVTFPIGTVILGHYCVESLLGKGTQSAVYLVRDQAIKYARDQLFVLKHAIALNKQGRHRLLSEGTLFRQLSHRALPHVYDVFGDDGRGWLYMLMEYIEGPHLDILRHQQPEQRFSWSEAMMIMVPIIDAVGYLHRQQPSLIHGDIKPANIIVKAGTGAVLVDFGVGLADDADATLVVGRASSLRYRAPEQVGAGSDTRTDVYGLGATFYRLLTGMVPADPISRVTQLSNEGTDPLKPANEVAPAVPVSLAQVIGRAMALRVHDRFSSVEELWAALRSQGEHRSPVPSPPLALRGAVTRPATVSVAKRPPPTRSSKSDTSSPRPSKKAVTRPATVSPSKPSRTARSSRPEPTLPVAPKQTVENPAPVEQEPQPTELPNATAASSTIVEPDPLSASEPPVPTTAESEQLPESAIVPVVVAPLAAQPQQPRITRSWRAGSRWPVVLKQAAAGGLVSARKPLHAFRSWKAGILLISLVLVIGLGVGLSAGAVLLARAVHHPAAHSVPPSPHPASATPAPFSVSTSNPTIAGTFTGTMYDVTVNVETGLSLVGVRQNGGNISGYLVVNPPLTGSGPFRGTVDSAQHLQFTVTDAAGHPALFFEGDLQPPDNLSGDYYRCSPTPKNPCDQAPSGYGIWNAILAPSG